MIEITDTDLARNLRKILNRVEFGLEEVVLVRNHHEIARVIPGSSHQTALEAMSDLYETLDDDSAAHWLQDSRSIRPSKKSYRGYGSIKELRS